MVTINMQKENHSKMVTINMQIENLLIGNGYNQYAKENLLNKVTIKCKKKTY